mmetsp:Transcript_24147/g.18397  ORF Transcript_24147/g.18397 Transcript_24147/m.18397 type:complete len:137 (-) Transcript_24147:64-474(-)
MFFFPESPVFLCDKGKFQQARRALNSVAKVNRKRKFRGLFKSEIPQKDPQKEVNYTDISNINSEEVVKIRGELRELWTVRVLLVNTLLLLIVWSVVSFAYYMINFQVKYIEGSIFTNTIFSSLSEFIAYILAGLLS